MLIINHRLNSLLKISIYFILILLVRSSQSQPLVASKHYLYLSVQDKVQPDAAAGSGILVFDIDNNHKFVKRINNASFSKYIGLRGFEASLANKSAYYITEMSLTKGILGRINLETDKVDWEVQLDGIGDRACVSADGKTLYVPGGYWVRDSTAGIVILNAETGARTGFIKTGQSPHMCILTPDGKDVLTGGAHWLSRLNVNTQHQDLIGYPLLAWDAVVPLDQDLGNGGIAPFTVDGKSKYAYFGHHNHIGFDVVDLGSQKVAYHVSVLDGNKQIIARRTYGIGLTPDERELWVVDPHGSLIWIFDNTKMPPVQVSSLTLPVDGHGWVHFSKDGRYAWTHTSDVYDAKTKKKVATLLDENGHPVSGSKFFEAHFSSDGKLVWVGSQVARGAVMEGTVSHAQPILKRPSPTIRSTWHTLSGQVIRYLGKVNNKLF